LQTLPHAVQALVHAVRLHCQQQDRSNVCQKNDCTIDSHAAHFARWLAEVGYNDWSISLIGPSEGPLLLEAYLHVIATQASARLPSSKTTLRASTILLYLKAASLWFRTSLHLNVPVVCPVTQKFSNRIAM